MKRPWAVIVAAAVLVGCRNSQPATNPFLRTTVPPPATGAVVVAPGELYTPPPVAGAPVVQPGAPAVVTPAPPAQVIPAAPPAVTPPPPAMPPRDPRYVPPGGTFQYHQSSNDRGKTLDLSAIDDDPSVADVGESPQPAANKVAKASPQGKVIAATHQERVVEPSVAENVADAAAEPAVDVADADTELEDSKNALRIVGTRSVPLEAAAEEEESETTSRASPVMHLVAGGEPARGQGASSSTFKEVSRTSKASPTEETSPNEDRVAQAAKPSAKNASGGVGSVNAEAPDYAFGPDYTWLRGRLEYSQTARSWKLRYIPIDGQTDSYGGSVVLADSPALAAFKPGDTVSARGALAGASSQSGSFSPLYQLQQIEPVVR